MTCDSSLQKITAPTWSSETQSRPELSLVEIISRLDAENHGGKGTGERLELKIRGPRRLEII